MGRTVFPGQFVQLSAKGGAIYASWPAPLSSNLKIWLAGDSGTDVLGELYAKVVEGPHQNARSFTVRFTSVSPSVAIYLQRLLAAISPQSAA